LRSWSGIGCLSEAGSERCYFGLQGKEELLSAEPERDSWSEGKRCLGTVDKQAYLIWGWALIEQQCIEKQESDSG